MTLNEERLKGLIGKLLTTAKPKGVLDIDFELRACSKEDSEYYLSLTYVVPDASCFLVKNIADVARISWNSYLTKTISNYFDIRALLTQSGITSESFHKREKERIR